VVDVSDIIGKLNPKTQKRVHAASEVEVEKQPMPSVAMTMALHGGIGYGRQTLIWGNKSSGKSSLCQQMIADAQKSGKSCAWIDSEESYDPKWATRLGVNNEQLIHSRVKTIEEMTEVGVELMQAGIDVLVVDSISAFLSGAYFDKSHDLKELGDTKQIGSDARDMGNAVRMFNYANDHTALVLISQIRNKISSWGAVGRPTGGNAVEFFSSTSIKLTSSATEKNQKIGDVIIGDKIFQQPVGRPVNWLVEFNKLGPPNQSGEYDFYYEGDSIGVDPVGETVDIAEKFSVITKKGAWYTVDGVQMQGRDTVIRNLRAEPDLYEKIVRKLHEQIP
jgi:recombination protein RecA